MATPETEPILQEPEDIERFSLSQSYFQMTETAAWKDLVDRMQGLVDQAQQDHFSSRETEPLKIIEEKLRWQQRLLMKQAMLSIVESQSKVRTEILEELQGDVNEF